jgi:hypothetical protein
MSQIETAFPGDQKLPAHRSFLVTKSHLRTGGGSYFGGPQSRGSASDDTDMGHALLFLRSSKDASKVFCDRTARGLLPSSKAAKPTGFSTLIGEM